MVVKAAKKCVATQRLWRTISREVCAAQGFPPGFRLVIVRDGRAVRDDFCVWTENGYKATYPDDFRVKTFLKCFLDEDILGPNPDFEWDDLVLKDHRNRIVDSDAPLWKVQDMAGNRDLAFDKRRAKRDDFIADIENKIETICDDMAEEFDAIGQNAQRLLPSGILEFVFNTFETEYLEYLLARYAEPGCEFHVGRRFRRDG